MSSLTVYVVWIMDQVREMARDTLRFDIHRSFTIIRSHYENIDLEMMSQCFMPGYSNTELEDIEKEVAPLAQDLSAKIKDEIIPPQKIS